ncbi:gliding motility-associated C-terminal domain-containing protein [Chitinophaga sancti]|uniref:T9SS type B sorting domain-containing protein n=1 Tax=Chitinophaga sancti TaxID=1004 RepID=UPI002A7548F4|nr:gliding motility-associated C-terminal domain-containing protein [Chitinophaga sancti]WPQ60316.1 gliding motility-associated C-terminal domain-containing protein [Chitinophaga sancti]
MSAQTISLKNPSLEGTAGLEKAAPPEWSIVEETPDIQPGVYGITMSASAGNTYVGMVATTYIQEGITQLLSHPLDSGKSYSLSFDLAYAANYSWAITYGGFAIYGGNEFGKREELLWISDNFTHTDWKQYQAVFTPSQAYNYIIFSAYKQPGDSIKNIAGVLVDNFSSIREVIQLALSSENSCNGANGVAVAKVMNADDDYSYLWSTGDTSSKVVGLKNGVYQVTVRGLRKKTTTYGKVKVKASELSGTVNLTPLSCNGAKNGIIHVAARGGILPYAYYLNDAETARADSIFAQLSAGKYEVKVMDAGGCTAVIDKINLQEPEALVVTKLDVTPETCAGAQDSRLVIGAKGGVVPYKYSVPGYARFQSDSVFTKLSPGHYVYSVVDKHQCEVTGDIEINKDGRGCSVFVPTAFSPNGDGVNDVFRAVVHDYITNFSMVIFNRWGQRLFESRNPDIGWNGTFKDIYLDPGGYLYVVTYTDSKGQDRKHQGTLVLVR